MKILVIPSWYPNKKDPLWGNYFIKQTKELKKYANVSMMYVNRVGIKNIKDFISELKTDGYNDILYKFPFYKKSILNLKSVNLDFSYKVYAKAGYNAYKKLIKYAGRPDIILVESSMPAGFIAKYIKEKDGIPYIIHAHSMDLFNNIYYKNYAIDLVKNANLVMCVNSDLNNLISNYNKNSIVVPNYIDCKKFDIKKKEHKTFNLLSVSNFYKVKRVDLLLNALDIVINKKGYKDIRLNIVGTGTYKSYYESVSNSLNLSEYVTFTGFIDNDELPKMYAKSDVLCVSSSFETFCIPIIEAFSSGIPIISTKCTGPVEIVNKDNGILVDIDDVEGYANAIIKMYKNYSKYDSDKIKDYVVNKYDKDVICKKIIDICNNTIK